MSTLSSWEVVSLLIFSTVITMLFVAPTNACESSSGESSLLAVGTQPQVQETTYFIDYENGNDDALGTSPNTAWKHAPGDPKAGLKIRKTKLVPGDTILFKAGVPYRGEISIEYDGSDTQPIRYVGVGWGDGNAILDGSEKIEARWNSCQSAGECGGNPNWQNIVYADLPEGMDPFAPVYEGNKMMWFSQDPNQPDPFWYNNTANYYFGTMYNPNIRVTKSTITDNYVLTQDNDGYWNQAYVAIWAQPNVVYVKKVIGYNKETHTITYNQLPADIYADKTVYYSLLNHISLVDVPGEYYYNVETKRVYLWPSSEWLDTFNVYVGKRSVAIDIRRHSNIIIEGFVVRNYFGSLDKSNSGMAIYSGSGSVPSKNVTIKNNEIVNLRSMAGGNTISIQNAVNLNIEGNYIHDCQRNMGIYVSGDNVTIRGNRIVKIGRTGILLNNTYNSMIIDNVISDILDIHGNGISIYLDNRNILLAGNKISNAYRPLTIQGNGDKPVNNNIVIYNNIMIGKGTDAAITSWGNNIQGVVIANNILFGDLNAGGISLKPTDKNIVVKNNIMDGFNRRTTSQIAPEWQVSHNAYVELNGVQFTGMGVTNREGELKVGNTDIVFLNKNVDDFPQAEGSPTIHAGVDVIPFLSTHIFKEYNFKMDRDGNEIIRWDIGCYSRIGS